MKQHVTGDIMKKQDVKQIMKAGITILAIVLLIDFAMFLVMFPFLDVKLGNCDCGEVSSVGCAIRGGAGTGCTELPSSTILLHEYAHASWSFNEPRASALSAIQLVFYVLIALNYIIYIENKKLDFMYFSIGIMIALIIALYVFVILPEPPACDGVLVGFFR